MNIYLRKKTIVSFFRILIFANLCCSSFGQGMANASSWDRNLPDLGLKDVHVKADRLAARNYLEMRLRALMWGNPIESASTPESALWTAIGMLEVFTRAEHTTHKVSISRIQKSFTDNEPVSPGLKALAAVEYARVTKDTTFLEQVAKQPLSESELSDVKYDLIRNLRYSAMVRNKLIELNPAWAGFSKADIEVLGQMNYLHLP